MVKDKLRLSLDFVISGRSNSQCTTTLCYENTP